MTYWGRAGAPLATICIALIMTSCTLSSVQASERVKSWDGGAANLHAHPKAGW
jgi:hypothetical protein